MRNFLSFIFVMCVIAFIVGFTFIFIKKSKNTFYKLYKMYSKDENYKCNNSMLCTKEETIDIDGYSAKMTKKIKYDEHDNKNSYYEIIIEIDNLVYYSSTLVYNDIKENAEISFRINLKNEKKYYMGSYDFEKNTITGFRQYSSEYDASSYNRAYVLSIIFLQKYIDILNEDFTKIGEPFIEESTEEKISTQNNLEIGVVQ